MRDRAQHARGRLLDIGCGSAPYRDVFSNVHDYIGLDFAGDVDVVGSGLNLPFRDECFDTILCNEVLEHVPEPATLMGEAFRVLRKGGTLLLTTPQTWGLHLEPYDYYRYTKYGLRHLAEQAGLDVLEVGPTCGVWATVSQRVVDVVAHDYLQGRGNRIVGACFTPLLAAGYALDMALGMRGDSLDNVLVARRPRDCS
jgi:SAM-dependent methyltransferase